MKEATGELNITVITIVAISAIAALFYAFIWPTIKGQINRTTYCSTAWGCTTSSDGKTRTCTNWYEGETPKTGTLKCPTQ